MAPTFQLVFIDSTQRDGLPPNKWLLYKSTETSTLLSKGSNLTNSPSAQHIMIIMM